jgi:hypothetical protein
MSMYEAQRGHPADFLVTYRFYAEGEGGRSCLPTQHYRGDFLFAEDDPSDGIWIIHHEFLDEDSAAIERGVVVPQQGQATMWIVFSATRARLRDRIVVGTRYGIMEGSKQVGEGVVTALLGLHANPT